MSLLLTFGKKSVIQRAISVLRKYGTDAHAYIPGVGVLNGLTAGNYTDSALTAPGSKDQFVGGVTDALDGIHATQGAAGNKPVLRQGPVNLLTYSHTFTNGAWAKTGASVDLTANGPTGAANSATRLTEDTGNSAHDVSLSSPFAIASGAVNTAAYIVKAAGRTLARIVLTDSSYAHRVSADINLSAGTISAAVITGSATSSIAPSIVSVGNGYFLVAVSGVMSSAVALNTNIRPCTAVGTVTYTGTNSVALEIYGGGLFLGNLTANQILAAGGIPITTSAKASAGTGPSYWEFGGDGAPTDYLSLGSLPFIASDDYWVVAAFSLPQAATANQCVFGLASTSSSSPVSALWTNSANLITAYWRGNTGAVSVSAASGALPINTPIVASMLRNGNDGKLRVGGSQIGGTVGVSTVGTTTVNTATIGALQRPTFAQYWPGNIYAVLCGKGTISDADLLLIEKLAANLAGVTL